MTRPKALPRQEVSKQKASRLATALATWHLHSFLSAASHLSGPTPTYKMSAESLNKLLLITEVVCNAKSLELSGSS